MNIFQKIGMSVFAAVLVSFSSAAEAQTGQFGRYVGTLKHERLGKDQLAKIDFIVSRTEGNAVDLKAVLTLHFGDFRSGEYVSYHFDKVNFNLLTGALSFDQADEDVTLVTTRFSNGELVGRLRSASAGQIGEISLKLNGTAEPSLGIIEPLNGEYVGVCDGEKTILQVHTLRSTEDSSRVGSPFAANDIRAQIGKENDPMCRSYPTRVCNKDNFQSGAYNFYKGELRLVGELTNLKCKVSGDSLQCDNSCNLSRRSIENKSRIFSPPAVAAIFLNAATSAELRPASDQALAGTYEGYVHNEYLNTYQPIQIDLATYQSSDGGESNLKISATASLFFGPIGSSEAISYRFEPRDYPNPILRPQFVLSRLEDDVDAFLKVTTIGDGVIRGEWFSLLFGRVGAFEARKGGGVLLTAESKTVTPLAAFYTQTENFELDLEVFQGSSPPNTENPFYPLQLGGNVRLKIMGGGRKEPIKGGSYDFYTGRFGLLYDDGRLIAGTRNENRDLQTIMTSNGYGTIMPIFDAPRIFKVTDQN